MARGPFGFLDLGGSGDVVSGGEARECAWNAVAAMQDLEAAIGLLRRLQIAGPKVRPGDAALITVHDLLVRAGDRLSRVLACSRAMVDVPLARAAWTETLAQAKAVERLHRSPAPPSFEALSSIVEGVSNVAQRNLRNALGGS